MAIFGNLFRSFNNGLSGVFGFAKSGTRSKVNVDAETALNVTAFLCGVRVLAEGVAQPPVKVNEINIDEQNRRIHTEQAGHWSYNLLAVRPNSFQTSFEFRELMVTHAVVCGNGYAFINRATTGARKGEVRELIPMAPDTTRAIMRPDGEVEYKTIIKGQEHTLARDQVFHLRGPSWNGFSGINIVSLAREAIGLSSALERQQADHFGKGARPDGVLSTDSTVAEPLVVKIRDAWAERFGVNGEGGTAILDNGWAWSDVTMTAIDSQMIESRGFQIQEIGRALRVYPLMMMHSDKAATFASASEFFTAHVVHSLGPWYERFEQAYKRDVIGTEGENAKLWLMFMPDGLMRGNPKERAEFYDKMAMNGTFTRNENRASEGRNPLDGLDEPLTPMNMSAGQPDTSTPPPTPPEETGEITNA